MTKAIVFGVLLMLLAGAGQVQSSAAREKGWRYEECRFKNVGTRLWSPTDVERTIRCVADKEGVDATTALAVWHCESGWAYEPPHSDCCHGPMQYMVGTFESQFERLEDAIHRRYGNVAEGVHNIRANLTTAIVFVGHGGSWSPTWSCA